MKKEYIYKERGSGKPGEYLNDSEYRRALQTFVKYCHDVVFLNKNNNFLLAERNAHKAAAGVWYIGGQVKTYTPLLKSLQATIKRETGLMLSDKRFKYFGQMRGWFTSSANGAVPQDSLSEMFFVKLTDTEIKKIKLDEDEYVPDSLKPYTLKDLKIIKEKKRRDMFLHLWKLTH
jgi:hypothetical protein